MGNRHMATERTHNRVHRQRKGGRGLTPAERKARAHGIHNRGEGAEMNGQEQKRQATLKEELGQLALASAEEFRAVDVRITRLAEQIATLHRELKDERLKRQQMSVQDRHYVDGRALVLYREIRALADYRWYHPLRALAARWWSRLVTR